MLASEPVLDSVVFEVRYVFGYLYIDRCGQIILDVERHLEGWVNNGPIDPDGAHLENPYKSYKANFNMEALAFVADKPDKLYPDDTCTEAKTLAINYTI